MSEILLTILLTTSTAAIGYLINDFRDVEADKINKPGRNIFEKRRSSTRITYRIYVLLSMVIGLLGLFISIKMTVLLLLISSLLFLYALRLKSTVLVGNILIAFCQALVFLPVYWQIDQSILTVGSQQFYLIYYSIFAGLTGLIREIIKDVEDKNGDHLMQVFTVGTQFNLLTVKRILLPLQAILILGISVMTFVFYIDLPQSVIVYYFIFLMIPISLRHLINTKNAIETKDWSKQSQWIKIIMLAGILSIAILPHESTF